MPKYLTKRRNLWGIWTHLDTVEYPPSKNDVERKYGPGEYEILMAQEGIIGLRHHDNFTIPWNIDFVEWVEGRPTAEYVKSRHGDGYYFIIGNTIVVDPVIASTGGNGLQYTKELMSQGAAVMRNIYLVFRIRLPW